MTKPEQDAAAQAAVRSLMQTRKAKALALAVLVATTSATSGCTLAPQTTPCPPSASSEPCVQPSGDETTWIAPPHWPAQESGPGGSGGQHLASHQDFVANPQYTQLRAGQESSGSSGGSVSGPRYYGGMHSYWFSTYGYSSGNSWSSGGGGGPSGISS